MAEAIGFNNARRNDTKVVTYNALSGWKEIESTLVQEAKEYTDVIIVSSQSFSGMSLDAIDLLMPRVKAQAKVGFKYSWAMCVDVLDESRVIVFYKLGLVHITRHKNGTRVGKADTLVINLNFEGVGEVCIALSYFVKTAKVDIHYDDVKKISEGIHEKNTLYIVKYNTNDITGLMNNFPVFTLYNEDSVVNPIQYFHNYLYTNQQFRDFLNLHNMDLLFAGRSKGLILTFQFA